MVPLGTYILTSAVGAMHSVRPAHTDKPLFGGFIIGEYVVKPKSVIPLR